MKLNPLILYICSVNILCVDATSMPFRSAKPLTVWRVPCCSEFITFDVGLFVIKVCPSVIFSKVGQSNLLKTVCAIDRLKLCKHCYHSVYFPVVVWSQSVTCLTLHKHDICALFRLIINTHIKTDLILLNKFRLMQGACLTFVRMSQIFHRLTSYS